MKFHFEEEVVFKNEFATYKGVVVSFFQRRSMRTLWLMKENWYQVFIHSIDNKPCSMDTYIREDKLRRVKKEGKLVSLSKDIK